VTPLPSSGRRASARVDIPGRGRHVGPGRRHGVEPVARRLLDLGKPNAPRMRSSTEPRSTRAWLVACEASSSR